jgi:hypothetical protein
MEQEFKTGDIVSIDYDSEWFNDHFTPEKIRPKHLLVRDLHNARQKGLTPGQWNNAKFVLGVMENVDSKWLYANVPANICRKISLDNRPLAKKPMNRSW